MGEEMRIVLRNWGKIDPLKIEDYIGTGGYESLNKARHMSRLDVIEEVKRSGLRGRGGAGFNTGLKWSFSHNIPADEKYVICNADEGEPGTYKDRILLESDPHSVLEGMAICGYAIGAKKGYIYCRGEYPFLVDLLNTAIAQAKEKGVLGDFDVEVRMGGGAYVCGEESALIESIEGHRGEPRFKPPFPPVSGLWGKPTIVNNVETFANIGPIMEKGADWYAGIGAKSYPGTKVLSLTGDVANCIVIEVPTDTTIRDVIYDFGGGVKNGGQFQAVQIGGTSGAFIPESLLDTAIDFDSMRKIDATLGTGAVFVMNRTRDVVDIVTRIAKFFVHESCGKCTPCREGSFRCHEMLTRINAGKGTAEDMDKITRLGRIMQKACLCGCGQAAPSPILTTLQHFRQEYERKLAAV
ncbi:NADH-quinone oxidoreductase subunit NuoF [Candidatus Formimonas warabiya]|uniref:NADH-quinone oxidoreductase subunit F n=1 Tax=Formimonas warabiya TaxID=1761012 RepID=A0A3G1KTH0_FORW1|nr:NADH-quinone oxidoreductase subunit NuoF [Candidatus Formimonas warabiya]ATW25736.1 NADH-quinone oxidoreductase subunit F [Candidatus Formimonas warabiya]